ncbi:MAG: hypothetical protein BWY11_01906 [Firmicutes bacterium ADurb.Bin182]|nr:MAG: hypothetical protein BWY11_01906 [Firmicutes bacterium ADurb.Bin182]
MRCSCGNCGTYMIQSEKGLESGCICPECRSFCGICLGTAGEPKTPSQLRKFIENLPVDTDEEAGDHTRCGR